MIMDWAIRLPTGVIIGLELYGFKTHTIDCPLLTRDGLEVALPF